MGGEGESAVGTGVEGGGDEGGGGGVELGFGDRGVVGRAVRGEGIGLEGERGLWEGEREGVWRAFEGLVGMMGEEGGEKERNEA